MTDIVLQIDGHAVSVAPGVSVAAAIALSSSGGGSSGGITRRSVGGAARAPLCGMGVCQECRVSINGRLHQLACQTLCSDGMYVLTGEDHP